MPIKRHTALLTCSINDLQHVDLWFSVCLLNSAAAFDPVPEHAGRHASLPGRNRRPAAVNSRPRASSLARTARREPTARDVTSSPRAGALEGSERRWRLIDVWFNHRLANPDERQTFKPIAAKEYSRSIFILGNHKTTHSCHGEGRTANTIICGENPLSNWPRSGTETILSIFISFTHTRVQSIFLVCYVVTGVSHDPSATVSLRHRNLNSLMAF